VRLDELCGIVHISNVPKTVGFDPELKNYGNRLVSELFVRTPFCVFRFTLQEFSQSIISLSPLFETA
jgi:hypothetical protein